MPGRNFRSSPEAIPDATVCLWSWSSSNTAASTVPARANASDRTLVGTGASVAVIEVVLAGDSVDDEGPHEVEDDDRDHRREVEHPDRGDEAAEQPQVRLRYVSQEVEDSVEPARVRRP